MLIQYVFCHSPTHLITVPTMAASTPLHSPPSKIPSSVPLLRPRRQSQISVFVAKVKSKGRRTKTLEEPQLVEAEVVEEGDDDDDGARGEGFPFADGFREDEEEEDDDEDGRGSEGFYGSSGYGGGKSVQQDFDRDPEIAEILGSCFDDPQKAQTRVEERIRRKRNKVLHTKTGSAKPMKVTFNKFSFSNSYIWFEFYNAPLTKDITLICDTIRAWHIVGRLGGCNSMNMQLSQAPLENKRPTYDPIQGANVTPTTFYNIGDLEMQDNFARIWVDIGTSEPLLLDVLINALSCLSSDYVGIKQVVFGGTEFEGWKENLTSEDAGYSTHKI